MGFISESGFVNPQIPRSRCLKPSHFRINRPDMGGNQPNGGSSRYVGLSSVPSGTNPTKMNKYWYTAMYTKHKELRTGLILYNILYIIYIYYILYIYSCIIYILYLHDSTWKCLQSAMPHFELCTWLYGHPEHKALRLPPVALPTAIAYSCKDITQHLRTRQFQNMGSCSRWHFTSFNIFLLDKLYSNLRVRTWLVTFCNIL